MFYQKDNEIALKIILQVFPKVNLKKKTDTPLKGNHSHADFFIVSTTAIYRFI